jgi:Rrf2 family protein
MAAHALALLSGAEDGYPSGHLALSVNTNPVFLRRILGDLVSAGLVTAREGRAGGYALSRPADRITLDEVYRAVEPEGPLAPSPAEPSCRCPVGSGMREAFEDAAALALKGLLAGLRQRTVADLARAALTEGRRARGRAARQAKA